MLDMPLLNSSFQPALKKVFCLVNKDGNPLKESVKEHLWSLHFDEYGRYIFRNICVIYIHFYAF